MYLHFSIGQLCPSQDTNFALHHTSTYQDPEQGTRAPGREKPAWTHQSRSTRPPCLAMADFTRLANWTASSSGCGKTTLFSRSKGPHGQQIGQARFTRLTCLVIGGKYQTLQTMAQLVIILRR